MSESNKIPQPVIFSEEISNLSEIKSKLELETNYNFRPVLIGSKALAYHYPLSRTGNDFDLICNTLFAIQLLSQQFTESQGNNPVLTQFQYPDYKLYKLAIRTTNGLYDLEIITSELQSGYRILKDPINQTQQIILRPYHKVNVASMITLEAIKTSHIYHTHGFMKHIQDLHMLRRYLKVYQDNLDFTMEHTNFISDHSQVGPVPTRTSEVELLVQNRRHEIDLRKGKPAEHINLNMSNDNFLERDGNLLVEKMIKHDDIHNLVKFGDQPMYTRLKTDQSQATCQKDLWLKLCLVEQRQCVMEESMVLALERYLLPQYLSSEQDAYQTALQHVGTNITKGWFRKFTIDQYPVLLTCPKPIKKMAETIISDYQRRLEDEYVQKSTLPPQSLSEYFTDQEYPLAKCMAEHLQELEHESEDQGNPYVTDEEISETESLVSKTQTNYSQDYYWRDYMYKQKQKLRYQQQHYEAVEAEDQSIQSQTKSQNGSILKWRNRHSHDNQIKEDLGNYNGCDDSYSNHNTEYELPQTIRDFRIREVLDDSNVLCPNLYIRITTNHELAVYDCSESLRWKALVRITRGLTPQEGTTRLEQDSWSLNYDKKDPHELELNIEASNSDSGGSDSSGTRVNVEVKQQLSTYISLALRVILGVLTPHMIRGGEILLGKEIVEQGVPFELQHLTKVHPWYVAYCQNSKH